MQRKDFNDLLLNREEVERIIGMTITKSNAEDNYLEDYRMYPELCLHDVVCLCLGLHPKDWNAHQHPRYTVIHGALQQGAETGRLPSRRESDYYEGDLYYITHDTAREWAKANGLKWDVPPYNPVTFENEPLDKNHLETRNAQLEQEIARLQAENEQLRAMQEVDNGGNVATLSEYEGELPPKTDADKLADFIELVFNPDLLDNGKIPTYSRLHTKLTAKYRDRKITAKNTIKKYLNQF